MKRSMLATAVLLGFLVGPSARAQAIQQHLAALKSSIAASEKDLRTYQWVETTTVSVNGQQRSWKEQACYYGADGTLQKTPIASSPPPQKKFGLRGAIRASRSRR